jgi:hypothetical protein
VDADSAERERVTRELIELAGVPYDDIDEERTEDNEFLSYIALGVVARHVLEWRLDSDEAAAFFRRIESLIETGSPNVRNLVIVGFIETLQNIILNSGLTITPWEKYLGPRTVRGWRGVDAFWMARMPPEEFNQNVRTGFA